MALHKIFKPDGTTARVVVRFNDKIPREIAKAIVNDDDFKIIPFLGRLRMVKKDGYILIPTNCYTLIPKKAFLWT